MNKITLILLLIGFSLGFQSCDLNKNKVDNKLISVSILPQKYFIERIAGDDFKVNVLIPPGASPASYEPTPKQMKDMSKSSLYLRIGHIPFEKAWLNKLFEGNDHIKSLDMSEGIELLKGPKVQHGDHFHQDGIDPHIWSSPKTAKQLIANTYKVLVQLAPEKTQEYTTNYMKLMSDINVMDKGAETIFAQKSKKAFMIYHPALSYLARDYGLTQISIEHDGKAPSPAHMKNIIDLAKENNIKTIFIQKQFNIENATVIAKEINAELVQIDPLSADWLTEMNRIISYLKN
ncbi:metal ABC transporter solute-binding protein, Zn/Mn family [Ancylomarina sp. 16SWW S1-10-2]|uniref:metal ABC transporter solute-binding protein, Zn/Mn family n=1 Tax=Ancylomarina sp. 16SWW S1-10-2 TaxID=2499681 RepID=UPI0012AEAAF3|nr:zinc ABC transporter substrate-binding protein [Ancylomarina sp. 16SWW S1-10-2]